MHYVLMIHADESLMPEMPASDLQAIGEAVEAFDRELTEEGKNLGSIRLRSAAAATTLSVRNGEVVTTDGPFIETKEQLGGIYIVEAEDMREAVDIARRLPMSEYGSVEIRPVLGLDLRQAAFSMYDAVDG